MLDQFAATHAEYAEAWAFALRTGDTGQVEAMMAPGYHGWFATSAREVHPFDRGDAVGGMRQSVARLKGAEIAFTRPVLSSRGEREALISYQKEIRQDGDLVSVARVHESWSLDGGRWVVEREFTEHGATLET